MKAVEDPIQDLLSERYVRTEEACRFLAVSRATLYGLMNEGAIRYHKFGKSRRIFAQERIVYVERTASAHSCQLPGFSVVQRCYLSTRFALAAGSSPTWRAGLPLFAGRRQGRRYRPLSGRLGLRSLPDPVK